MAVGDTLDIVPSTLPDDLFPSQAIFHVLVQHAASPSSHSQLVAYQSALSRKFYLVMLDPRNIHDHARKTPPGRVDIEDQLVVVRDNNRTLVGGLEEVTAEATATEPIDVEQDFLRRIPVIVDLLEEAFLNVVDSN
jgi:hypothetical protein